MMTRHDKVALAVSWWKMISGGQGHLSSDGSPLPWQESVPTAPADLGDAVQDIPPPLLARTSDQVDEEWVE